MFASDTLLQRATHDFDPSCGCHSCVEQAKEEGSYVPPAGEPGDLDGQIGPDVGGTIGTASSVVVGQTLVNTIDSPNDNDWFAINLSAGQTIQITLNGSSLGGGSLSDPLVRLYSGTGTLITSDDDGGPGRNSLLTFTAQTSGTYYISAEAFSTLTGTYTLSVQELDINPNDNWENSPDFSSPLLDAMSWDTQHSTTNLTVFFGQAGYTADGVTSEGWNAWEQQQVELALNAIAEVSGLSFTIVNSGDGADLELINDNGAETEGLYGYFNPPGFGGEGNDGVGVFNNSLWDRFANGDLTEGGSGYFTIMHELLHGLGLSHPHDRGGASSVLPGVGSSRDDFGNFDLNQGIWTMMSYNAGYHTGGAANAPVNGTADTPGAVFGYAAGPMAVDIAILQELYGQNTSHNAGNTTYVLPTASGAGAFWTSIWDAGGIDTIRHSGATSVEIDLRDATLQMEEGGGGYVSTVNGVRGGYTIAAGAVIENAFGGSSNDLITGNEADNTLRGFGGFDTISGGAGDDTIDGGNGADSIFGGAGDDSLVGGQGFDQLRGDAGDDTILGGDSNDYMFGGAGNDVIRGGVNLGLSTELLDGGAGNDTLFGEGGFDLLRGGDGDDLMNGGNQADNLYGDAGNDTLQGGAGLDRLFGGTGDDLLTGGEGNDGHFGQQGNDTMSGANGNDRFFGGQGNDLMSGGNGNDTMSGGAGFDTITGGAGDDFLMGNFNADTFVFAGAHGDDTVSDFADGNRFERIDLSGTVRDFNSVNSVLAHATQVGADVLIDTGGGNSVLLNGVNRLDLDITDFIF